MAWWCITAIYLNLVKSVVFTAVIYSGNFTTLAPERTRVERVTVLHSEHRLVALLVNILLG